MGLRQIKVAKYSTNISKIDKLENLAKKGDVSSQLDIGQIYLTEGKYKQAHYWLTKCAEQKNARAQFQLGLFYKNGISVNLDKKKAFNWFKKSAEQGYAEALMEVAIFYKNGWCIEANLEKAIDLIIESAEKGSHKAQLYLASYYHYTNNKNLSFAKDLYNKSADQGNIYAEISLLNLSDSTDKLLTKLAQVVNITEGISIGDVAFNLAQAYLEGDTVFPSIEACVHWTKIAAQLGSKEAQDKLGMYFLTGEFGFEQDIKQAYEWFSKAAKQGYASSQYQCGKICLNFKDYDTGISWLKKAADQDDQSSQLHLASIYNLGQYGIPQNEEESLFWSLKLAEQGNPKAQYLCANIYLKKNNNKDGLYWLTHAAQNNVEAAQYTLATFYINGTNDLEQNTTKAINWAEKAASRSFLKAQKLCIELYFRSNNYKKAQYWMEKLAESGDVDTQYQLGIMLMTKFAQKHDQVKSLYWLDKAANQGHAGAQYEIGCKYLKGISIEKDYEKAFNWFEKSAGLGFQSAMLKLGLLYKKGLGGVKDLNKSLFWIDKTLSHKPSQPEIEKKAQLEMAMMYGLCVEEGFKNDKSLYWLEKLVEFGDKDAECEMGRLYKNGVGFIQDISKAKQLFKSSMKKGGLLAEIYLGQMLDPIKDRIEFIEMLELKNQLTDDKATKDLNNAMISALKSLN